MVAGVLRLILLLILGIVDAKEVAKSIQNGAIVFAGFLCCIEFLNFFQLSEVVIAVLCCDISGLAGQFRYTPPSVVEVEVLYGGSVYACSVVCVRGSVSVSALGIIISLNAQSVQIACDRRATLGRASAMGKCGAPNLPIAPL